MKSSSVMQKWALPVVLLCGLTAFFALGLQNILNWQTMTVHYADINHFMHQNWLASCTGFMLVYATAVAFSLPIASLLTLLAGAIIGWPAVGLVVISATVGSCLVFIATRGLFRDELSARAGPFFASVESGFTRNAFSYLLFLRLIPVVPFWAVNILPALSRITIVQFVTATAIGIIPGTSVYVAVGRGFNHMLASGKIPDLTVLSDHKIWLPLIGLAALALTPVIHSHIKTKKNDKNRKL